MLSMWVSAAAVGGGSGGSGGKGGGASLGGGARPSVMVVLRGVVDVGGLALDLALRAGLTVFAT